MDKLFGLPAHPFLVHIPIVLLPLAAIGTVAIVVRRTWYQSFRWVVLGIAVVGAGGAALAASAGEELEGRIVAIEGEQAASGWEHHAQLGETARNIALVYVVLLAAYVLIPWLLEQRRRSTDDPAEAGGGSTPGWLRPALAVLALAGGAASMVTIVQAGHTGSKSVWEETVTKGDGG
jgi:uncharacterized membrane protein